MKKIFVMLGVVCTFAIAAPSIAQDKPAAPAATTATPAADAKAADAKQDGPPTTSAPSASTAPAPSAAPAPNKGDVSWMLVSTALVLIMSVPALALFYGGMVRSKNMLSVLMQVFVVFSLIVVLWTVYG